MAPLEFVLPPPSDVGKRVEYTLRGVVLDEDGRPAIEDGEPVEWAEAFETIPAGTVPSAVFFDLALGTRIINGDTVFDTRSVLQFLRATMRDNENRGRFDRLCRDPKRALQTQHLGPIAVQLVPLLTEVPGGALPNSPDGQPAPQGSSGPASDDQANASTT